MQKENSTTYLLKDVSESENDFWNIRFANYFLYFEYILEFGVFFFCLKIPYETLIPK